MYSSVYLDNSVKIELLLPYILLEWWYCAPLLIKRLPLYIYFIYTVKSTCRNTLNHCQKY